MHAVRRHTVHVIVVDSSSVSVTYWQLEHELTKQFAYFRLLTGIWHIDYIKKEIFSEYYINCDLWG